MYSMVARAIVCFTGMVTTSCQNTECCVCVLINKLDRPTVVALGMKTNERLTPMMELAPSIALSVEFRCHS